MSDPQNHGLDELSQRLHAMAEAPPDPRLRPFQGAPLPIGPAGGRTPAYGAFEDVRLSPPPPPVNPPAAPPAPSYSPQYPSPPTSYPAAQATQTAPSQAPSYPSPAPAAPEPFSDYGHTGSTNGSASSTSGVAASGHNAPVSARSAAAASPSVSETASDPPSSSLPATAEDSKTAQTGMQRAVRAIRTAIPIVQRLLPLLDGNFATVLSNLVTQQPHHPPPPPQVRVDLEPVNRSLAEVRDSQRELATQVQEQGTSLKRVEDHLERVREATDRNTLEQQELVEDLRTVGSRLSLFAIIGLVLLGLSLALNIFFLIQLQHILR